jgi:predicted RNA-binding protein YlqC (UPF0109 family)
MNPDLTKTQNLIRRIISAIIAHPEHLLISPAEFRGAVYWNVQAHADDQPKIIGKQGSHIRALTFLVAEIGLDADSMYKIKLAEPEIGNRSDSTQIQSPTSYDASLAEQTLLEVIEAIFGPQSATITTTGIGLAYNFEITLRDHDEVPDLRVPYDGDMYEMTIIGSLGTLWRAWAKRDGVNFTVSCSQ